jgi:hypothetical protein
MVILNFDTVTSRGLRINDEGPVLNVGERGIPGLFAVGKV